MGKGVLSANALELEPKLKLNEHAISQRGGQSLDQV